MRVRVCAALLVLEAGAGGELLMPLPPLYQSLEIPYRLLGVFI